MEDADTPSAKSGQTLAGITILLMVIIGATTAVGLSPILPQIRAEFAATPGADFLTKALITVFGISALVGSPLTGWLLKHWGARNLFLGTAITFIAAGLGGMVAPNLIMLVFTRFVSGVAAAICGAAYYTFVMTQYPPGKRERWLGYLGTIGAIWAVVVSILAGELSQFGWRFALLTHLLALPLLVLIPVAFRKSTWTQATPDSSVARSDTGLRRMTPAIVVGLFSGAIVMSTPLYLPLQLSAIGVTDARAIGLLMAWYMVVSATSAFLYGNLRRFLSVAGVNLLAFSAAGAGYLSLALWPEAQWRLAELVVLGCGTGLLTPNLAAFAGRRGDAIEKAKSIGISKAAYFVGAFLFQALLAALAITAANLSLVALAMICIPGAAMLLAARPGSGRARASEPAE
ncbi:MAG: MFS transporter [Alphaproteobacteria bacterium]|nr:MFS transporter [Alphaproteobacteria bacterium]